MAILIAGAGIGGLTAGLALLRAGFDVRILEQASQLGEVGAGVQISANGSRVLAALGLGAELEAIGLQPALRQVRLWDTGRSWTQQALGASSRQRYGAPHYTVHRADLHAMLAAAVRRENPDAITLDARCISFRQDEHGVIATLANGEAVAGEALVGADGIHSVVRATLFGADAARFSGCMAWRGLVPMDRLPAHLTAGVNTSWVGEHSHIVTYPVRGGTLLNMVGVVERADWRVESWSQRGSHAELLADYAGWHEDVQTILGAIAEPFKWALMLRDPLPRWSAGRVTLLGDACHPTLPFLGQGAVMAIEDAALLARACTVSADIPAALARYERARVDRATRLVRASSENLTRLHAPALGRRGEAEAHIDAEFSQPRAHDRFDWLYAYDALTTELT